MDKKDTKPGKDNRGSNVLQLKKHLSSLGLAVKDCYQRPETESGCEASHKNEFGAVEPVRGMCRDVEAKRQEEQGEDWDLHIEPEDGARRQANGYHQHELQQQRDQRPW